MGQPPPLEPASAAIWLLLRAGWRGGMYGRGRLAGCFVAGGRAWGGLTSMCCPTVSACPDGIRQGGEGGGKLKFSLQCESQVEATMLVEGVHRGRIAMAAYHVRFDIDRGLWHGASAGCQDNHRGDGEEGATKGPLQWRAQWALHCLCWGGRGRSPGRRSNPAIQPALLDAREVGGGQIGGMRPRMQQEKGGR